MPSNRQILLDNRPEGEAVAGNFKQSPPTHPR